MIIRQGDLPPTEKKLISKFKEATAPPAKKDLRALLPGEDIAVDDSLLEEVCRRGQKAEEQQSKERETRAKPEYTKVFREEAKRKLELEAELTSLVKKAVEKALEEYTSNLPRTENSLRNALIESEVMIFHNEGLVRYIDGKIEIKLPIKE
jgi:hypothetical protein